MTLRPADAALQRDLRHALARQAYHSSRIRLVNRELLDASCLVASRLGLFAVWPDRSKLVAHGSFFGLRRHAEYLYAFEACDALRAPSRMGRVLRMRIAQGSLVEESVIATGLDNHCHQLGVIDGQLHVVDTANQAIVQLDGEGGVTATHRPFGDPDHDRYHHINSIAQIGDETWVMLHNGGQPGDAPSEIVQLDRSWHEVARRTLMGQGCHDIVSDAHGVVWHCGSMAGELLNSTGLRHKVSNQLTRGLAFSRDSVIVGTSQFALREFRTTIGGSVLFLSADLVCTAEQALPGAPTEIVAL